MQLLVALIFPSLANELFIRLKKISLNGLHWLSKAANSCDSMINQI